MFGNKAQTAPEVNWEKRCRDLEHQSEIKIKELEADHKLALREKEFELKHFKDEEVQKLKAELAVKSEANAVLKKENEMLDKITNLNADIIDIKDLVANLINKLPEIKLNNLTVNGSNKE